MGVLRGQVQKIQVTLNTQGDDQASPHRRGRPDFIHALMPSASEVGPKRCEVEDHVALLAGQLAANNKCAGRRMFLLRDSNEVRFLQAVEKTIPIGVDITRRARRIH
jgi:hypothetical protein